MSRRSEQLKAIATDFIRAHDDWSNEDNNRPPAPDEAYWDAVEAMLDAVEAGDIPAESRELVDAINAFANEADRFEASDDNVPDDGFWRAVAAIRKQVAGPGRRELPPLETVAELSKLPYIQDIQIAKMLGIKDRNGNLWPRGVQLERETPGCVMKTPGGMDGRDWIDPRLADLDYEEAAADRAEEAIEKRTRRERKADKPCPETPRQLWEQGVGIPQAARMLKQPEADVAKQFADWTAAKEFSRKVWELVDKAVPLDKIAKQLKADQAKVEAAIRERPVTSEEAA